MHELREAVNHFFGRIFWMRQNGGMARTVDREQRRQDILDGFARYVSRVGLSAATSRGLANEVGMAAGGLWNYFENFDELIVAAFRATFEPLNHRLDERRASPGLKGLALTLADLLPLDLEQQEEGQIAIAFMGNMGRDPKLYEIQAQAERTWAEAIRFHLEAAQEQGELQPGADVAQLTEVLLVVTVGLQMQWAVPESENRSPERQWQVVTNVLTPWLATPAHMPGLPKSENRA